MSVSEGEMIIKVVTEFYFLYRFILIAERHKMYFVMAVDISFTIPHAAANVCKRMQTCCRQCKFAIRLHEICKHFNVVRIANKTVSCRKSFQ